METTGHYVYIYLNPLKPGIYEYDDIKLIFEYEPFYIGKGKKDRFKSHIWIAQHYPMDSSNRRTHNKHKLNTINKILKEGFEPYIIIMNFNSHEEALNKEIELIKKIGRRDIETGPLTNMTDGGEGSCGRIWTEQSLIKLKLHCNNKGKNNPRYGKPVSNETREKIRKGNLGKKYSDEINLKKGSPGNKNPMFGKSVYQLWIEKYGLDEANIRLKNKEEKRQNTLKQKRNEIKT